MRSEVWLREITAQSSTEREALRLSHLFLERRPKPRFEVEDDKIRLVLGGFGLTFSPQGEDHYRSLKIEGKFLAHPTNVASYEVEPGKVFSLANLSRFVHDYTEASTWEKL